MEKKNLLLMARMTDDCLEQIEQVCRVTRVPLDGYDGDRFTSAELIDLAKGQEIVVIGELNVKAEAICGWKEQGVRLVVCPRGTPVNIDWKAMAQAELPLVYAPGRNAQAVAEFTFGLILALTRRIAQADARMRSGAFTGPQADIFDFPPDTLDATWHFADGSFIYDYLPMGMELGGRTLGLIGYGAIGRRVAAIGRGFGMRVLVYDAFVPAPAMERDGCIPLGHADVLAQSDVVSVHLPVTPQTRGLIDAQWFARMKKTAYFINTARAFVVDQQACIDAIVQQRIAGAAMDVCWIEPIPQNHPLLGRDNVLITPHIAAQTADIPRHQSEIVTQDILAYCKGEPLLHRWTRVE